MSLEQLHQFLGEEFPQVLEVIQPTELGEDSLQLRLPFKENFLRPGGTISGPTLMALADNAAYWLILAMLGPVTLAVTTSLNINFMRRPSPEETRATARLLKLGRQLVVVDVHIETASSGVLVAQATVTYSLPSAPPQPATS